MGIVWLKKAGGLFPDVPKGVSGHLSVLMNCSGAIQIIVIENIRINCIDYTGEKINFDEFPQKMHSRL